MSSDGVYFFTLGFVCLLLIVLSCRLEMGKGCKVVVCGQASVGKTAILEQLLYGNHTVGEWVT